MNIFKDIFRSLGEKLERHPFIFLGFAIFLLFIAFSGASQITRVTGNEAFIKGDDTYQKYHETFDQGNIAVLVRGKINDPSTIKAIDRFDYRMSNVENVDLVDSVSDRVREKYGRIPETESKIKNQIDSPKYSIINIIQRPDLSQKQQRPIYRKSLQAKEWARFPSGVSVTITGQSAFSTQLSSVIQNSTQTLLGLSVGFMIIALFFFFRGVRLRLLPIVAVFIGVIYTFGAMGYLGIPNSTLTSAVFPILIGLGIDYSVQFQKRYEEELDNNPPKKALPKALSGIGPAVLVAMSAAGLGFVATWMTSIDTPALVWFSQTSIIGILFSYLSGIILLLSILTIYTHRKQKKHKNVEKSGDKVDRDQSNSSITIFGRFLGNSSRKFAKHPILVILLAVFMMVSGFYVSEDVETLTDTEEFIPSDLPAYVNLQEFRSITGGGESVRYSVLVQGSGLKNPEILKWMEDFEGVAIGKPTITGINSPADIIKQYNGYEIPETKSNVENVLNKIPTETEKRYYQEGYGHITVFGKRDMDTNQVLSFIENTERSIEFSQPPPGVQAKLTGISVLSPPNIVETINQRNFTTIIGVLFVFLLLIIFYRDLVKATAPLIPMLFVIGWQGLYMYILGVKISPLTASLGALTVGIGAEYTIIVMERYFEEKEKGLDKLKAIEIATSRVGEAISVSGLTTIFGFLALTLSPFPILRDFGFVTVGIIGMTLIATITTLPPSLILLDKLSETNLKNMQTKIDTAFSNF